jgi:phospho-N-acetylmuramoyl-pentapeptide-transferase
VFTWLFASLQKSVSFLNLFKYITVRTALAGITALALSLLLGPALILFLKKNQIGQEIRADGPQSHFSKKGTPTMGGILIIGATLVPTLLWGSLDNTYVWLAMGTMSLFGLIGFMDDYLKVKKKRSLGLIARNKFLLQIVLGTIFGLIVVYLGFTEGPDHGFNLHLYLPFLKKWLPYLGWFYAPWAAFFLVGFWPTDWTAWRSG